MLLRPWLADLQRQTIRLLGINPNDGSSRRRNLVPPSGPESLEQRCVLTDFNLANLGGGGITIFGVDANDHSGYSVGSAGDVNGDGFDDVIIGADRARAANNAKYGAGETYVVFGNDDPSTTIDLANLGSAGVTIFGAGSSDFSGCAVSGAGDVNGDGFDDLIIGARGGTGKDNNQNFAGESYIVFGKESMPQTIDLANLGSAGVTIFAADAGDESGYSVAGAGDVNGDGFDDVIIGAPFSAGSGNSATYAGESYVIFGSSTLPTTIELATLGAAGITLFGADAGDNSGHAVSTAGDLNNDGIDDFAISSISAGGVGNALPTSGETYVIFGGQALPATVNLANLGAAGITIFGADPGDFSGYSLSDGGDVNGDGFDDLLIGAFHGDGSAENKTDSGESYVIFGEATLPTTINLDNLGSAGITIFGVDSDDISGRSISTAGDINDDGFDDILIGALLADGAGNAKPSAGESYLIFGSDTLPTTIELSNLGTAGITYLAIDAGDNVGQSVSNAGDVNGDGFDDIVIGARLADGAGNARVDSGESYVIFGKADRINNGPPVTYINKQPPITVLPQISVGNDVHPEGGTLTLAISGTPNSNSKKALDRIVFPATSGLGTSSVPQIINGKLTVQIQLSQNVTNSSIQSFLRGITFATKGKGLKTPTRTVDITLAEAGGGPVNTAQQTIHVLKKAVNTSARVVSKELSFPDVIGTWTIITDPEGAAVTGTLELNQKGSGKKITGTLTNAGQPPGSFTAKFVNSRAEFATVGKMLNRVISSKQIKFGCNLVGELLEGKYQHLDGQIHGPDGDTHFTGNRLPG